VIKIGQVEDALVAAEPVIETAALRDREYVTRRWNEHATAGRRALLRLAWSEIHLVKATSPGGKFGTDRIVFLSYTAPATNPDWAALYYGPKS
jgi:hypothetical protein